MQAVRVLEASYGPFDVRLGAALHNVGGFYMAQRDYANAQPYYERALKVLSHVSLRKPLAEPDHGNAPSMLEFV